ncbi:MAG: 3'(2'),5'-bisphosphate nucleotidase CysQ [Proteobacteria bacterium]|nr:3'(2'),5'-bisphosphate nucleotidase CysQ [Pseudomonadota bacterium]
MHTLVQDLELMVQAAEKAGEIAYKFQTEGFKRLEDKASGDPFLTEADLAIDACLRELLTAARPDYGWLSEETEKDDSYLTRARSFVVDPIDGTRDFVEGTHEFAISIGLIEDGKAVAGVIYNPMKKHLISGAVGKGVFMNGQGVRQRGVEDVHDMDVLISVSETRKGLWAPYQGQLALRSVGSVAYKLGLVAAGMADATASLVGKSFWDICAGDALCRAAGLKMTDLSGRMIRYNTEGLRVDGIIAAPEQLHTGLLTVLNKKPA